MALAFTLDANANLIADGGFEGNGNLTPNNGSYNNGDTGIPSWTVVASDAYRNVQWILDGTYPSINSFSGSGLVDLSGNPDYGPAALQQAFATTANTGYSVTFYLGYAEADMNFGGPVSATVSLGGANGQLFTTGGANGTQTNTVWTKFEYDFTATSASTLLRIEGTSGVHFIGLDAVDVELAPVDGPPPIVVTVPGNGTIPEPASLALLGLGIVGGVFARRRVTTARHG